MRPNPHVYEINTCLFIRRLSRKYNQALTVVTVPDEEWQLLARRGFDLVWLMGVWQRSPGARQQALLNLSVHRDYDNALPGWRDEDIGASPYAVYSYRLNPLLGQPSELAQLKSTLNRLGLGLILDFVPNHVALDHPWVLTHPGWFIQGNEADARQHPDWFFSPENGIYLAHGRDPNFPPWTDTVQMNFYSDELRRSLLGELLRIAEIADGVRCDMAMLALNDVFAQVWGRYANYPQPATEFWAETAGQVKQAHPGFLFIAEAYWGLEQKLQQIGFDFVYDKLFYDRLRFSTASEIRDYLLKDELYLRGAVRFIENHDEERAVTAFGCQRSLAAATILATIPGLRLFHDGQLEGRRVRLPVQLMREPEELPDLEVLHFYEQLLSICKSPVFHDGDWQMMDVREAEEGNSSHQDLLAWRWRYARQFKLVTINYSSRVTQGFVELPLKPDATGRVIIRDEITGKAFDEDAQKVKSQGLYLELNPWQIQILDI